MILEIDPQYQRDPTDLARVYVPGANGAQVPLTRGDQDRARPAAAGHQPPGPVSGGDHQLQPGARTSPSSKRRGRWIARSPSCICPSTLHAEFQGDARAYRQSIGAQPLLILAALFAVYIVLGVLYESLAHPLTIISTLPSAGLGALLALQICSAPSCR